MIREPSDKYLLFRHWVVRAQWLIFDLVWPITGLWLLLFGIAAVDASSISPWSSEWTKIVLAIGAALAFLHKHALDSEKECLRLFSHYNESFRRLGVTSEKLKSDPNTLEEYVDLSAEEYLLYVQGRIHPTIWRTWGRGMLHYVDEISGTLKDGRRHYGLTPERLKLLLPADSA
jgi:hypothetical protein